MKPDYKKVASDDVVIATESLAERNSPPANTPGFGMALLCLVVVGMVGGAWMMKDNWAEKNIYLEVGSGSNAMLLGPFAGSGAAAMAEVIDEIEEVVDFEEALETAFKNGAAAASAESSAPTIITTKATTTTTTTTPPSAATAEEASTTEKPAASPTAPVTSTGAPSTAAALEAVVLNEGGDPVSPDDWTVTFATTVVGANGESQAGTNIVIKVFREWAPLGADHFYALVQDGFYNEAAFFRVVPNFVVQFGIAGIPAENKKWGIPIKDDPVLESNKAKTLVYATAGPNTRTSQLFINYKDNSNLDSQGFAPFATVTEGFEYAQEIFNPTPGSSNGVDQGQYEAKGNDWIKQQYPHIDFIINATIGK